MCNPELFDIGFSESIIWSPPSSYSLVIGPLLALGGRKNLFFLSGVGGWNNHLHLKLFEKGGQKGEHPCIRPSFHTEETLKYNAISKNYHGYGSTVEYMGAPPFCPHFSKSFKSWNMLPQIYYTPKINLIAHSERFICLFKKRFEVQKNQWFFTLRDVIFWVILRPLLKKCTFFSFKNHISVSNCRMKLIFDSGEFWDSIFCKNKIFEKGGGGQVCGFEMTGWLH